MSFRVVLPFAVALFSTPVLAQDCPITEISDPALSSELCNSLNAILNGPKANGGSRGDTPDAEAEAIIGGNPLMGEAYRADPDATLALINRIRNAGGKVVR